MRKRIEHLSTLETQTSRVSDQDLLEVLENQFAFCLLGMKKKPLFKYRFNPTAEKMEQVARFIMALDLELESNILGNNINAASIDFEAGEKNALSAKVHLVKGTVDFERIRLFKENSKFLNVLFSPMRFSLTLKAAESEETSATDPRKSGERQRMRKRRRPDA